MERIALFLPSLQTGGAETVFLLLSRELSRLGYEIDLVVANARGPLRSRVSAKVRVYDLDAGIRGFGAPGFAATATSALAMYLRRRRPSVLLSTLTGSNHIATVARALSGIQVRLILREAITAKNRPGSLRQRLIRRVYPHADGIVAVSQGVAEDLAGSGIPSDMIQIIPNPVDYKVIETLSREPTTGSLGRSNGRPIVLGMGRLVPQKDFQTLVLAFSKLSNRHDARLIILGEGELREELQVLARRLSIHDRTEFPGNVANPYPYLRRALVFVLSSKWEGYPNALIEALALSKPVVATDCHSGPAEVLKSSGCGKLVRPGDAAAMSTAIGESLVYRGHCPPRQKFFEEHSLEHISLRYLDILGVARSV